MKPKHKALLLNFIAFMTLFLITRLTLGHYVPMSPIFLAVISAITATVFAPKFGAVNTQGGKKVMMKWIFIKGAREV